MSHTIPIWREPKEVRSRLLSHLTNRHTPDELAMQLLERMSGVEIEAYIEEVDEIRPRRQRR